MNPYSQVLHVLSRQIFWSDLVCEEERAVAIACCVPHIRNPKLSNGRHRIVVVFSASEVLDDRSLFHRTRAYLRGLSPCYQDVVDLQYDGALPGILVI